MIRGKNKYWIEIGVGLFVLAGLICSALLVFRVSGVNDLSFVKDYYTVTADFENVSGLKARSSVMMSGVTIGRVDKIEFDKKHFLANVTLHISNKVNNIPDDTEAKILTSGLLGDKYISLTEGYGSKTVLKDGSHIELENTYSTFSIEDLISKFLGGKAMNAQPKPVMADATK